MSVTIPTCLTRVHPDTTGRRPSSTFSRPRILPRRFLRRPGRILEIFTPLHAHFKELSRITEAAVWLQKLVDFTTSIRRHLNRPSSDSSIEPSPEPSADLPLNTPELETSASEVTSLFVDAPLTHSFQVPEYSAEDQLMALEMARSTNPTMAD